MTILELERRLAAFVAEDPHNRVEASYALRPEYVGTQIYEGPLMGCAAADDPLFVYPAPENSWGGGSQALMALRTLRYFEYYGFSDALKELMLRWLAAMDKCDDFRQQMDPFTGIFSTTESYSPAMCVAIEFCRKLENC